MNTLRDYILEAEKNKTAIGHFNISNLEGLWGVFRAAQSLDLPVIVGVSEGEREFMGVRQVAVLVKSLREQFNYPIFLNADHTYSFEKVREAIDVGFDAVIFDGAKLTLEENISVTKKSVEYARKINPKILVEGELGFIGVSSKLLDTIPEGVVISGEGLTRPDDAARFVKETGIDLLAPAVGNVHGMLKVGPDPRLNIKLISEIRKAAGIPIVLHGGSGTAQEDFVSAIGAGISVVHINTELRVAFKQALELSLQNDREEIAPYKFMKDAQKAVEKVARERLLLFSRN